MIHKQIYSRWTSVNTIPAASMEVIQKDVCFMKKKNFFLKTTPFWLLLHEQKKKEKGGGHFDFIISARTSFHKIYSNVRDLRQSDRMEQRLRLREMRITGRPMFDTCKNVKTQNTVQEKVEAWKKRNFPGIINFLRALSHHWMQFNYLTRCHFLSAPWGGEQRKMRAIEGEKDKYWKREESWWRCEEEDGPFFKYLILYKCSE